MVAIEVNQWMIFVAGGRGLHGVYLDDDVIEGQLT